MNFRGIKYDFLASPWEYSGKGAWIFVSVPETMAQEIRLLFKSNEEGWGRLKVTAQIDDYQWKTAIWFERKLHTYLLPLKQEVRKNQNITINNDIQVTIFI